MLNFLIADDHSIVIYCLENYISKLYPIYKIDKAKNGDEVFKLVKENDYDLVIVDISMPETDTSNLIIQLLHFKPNLKILVFSMYPEEFYANVFLKLGAKGYLSKEASEDEILQAIKTVLDGKVYMSDNIIRKFSEIVLGIMPENLFDLLSEKQKEVAKLLCMGMRPNDICELMNLHTSTIGTHKARIFRKLGVKNIVELRQITSFNNINL